MTENLRVRLSGGAHIGVPSALRRERAVARACNEAHHKPIFGVFAALSAFGSWGCCMLLEVAFYLNFLGTKPG